MWNDVVISRVLSLRQNGISWDTAAEVISSDFGFTVTGNAARKAVERYMNRAQLPEYALPEPTGRRFEDVLTLPQNTNALCIGDLHADLYNRDLLVRAIREAREYDVNTIIIGGDLFNADELSTHPHNERFTPINKEMDVVGRLLEYLGNLSEIDTIVITSGNHDERFTRKLNAYLSYQMVIHAALNGRQTKADILVTDLDYCYVNNSWVVGHLSNYSKIGGKLALDIARKHKRNAIVFHDHIQGVVADSEYIGISAGCMLQSNAFFYKERRLNTYSDFTNGFVILADNAPYIYNERGQHVLSGGRSWKDLEND